MALCGLLAVNGATRRVGVNLGGVLFRRVHAVLGGRMRVMVTGGSRFDPVIGADLFRLGFNILQGYGLTETSGAATLTRPNDPALDTVGQALPGNEVRIAPPEAGADAESGADGEVLIRGPIVMQGYFNRPDATAATLRDGWLYTGDLGRLDAEGRLSITGRKKELIVLSSGKNIYPEEIEAVYRQSAFIKELCVIGLSRPDEPAAERLYAVVVPDDQVLRDKKIANVGDIIRFEMEGASVNLPHHKRVLGYEIWMEPLPRTSTGKIKRFEIERRVKSTAEAQARSGRSGPGRGGPGVSGTPGARGDSADDSPGRQAGRDPHARRQPRARSRPGLHGARGAAHRARTAGRRRHPRRRCSSGSTPCVSWPRRWSSTQGRAAAPARRRRGQRCWRRRRPTRTPFASGCSRIGWCRGCCLSR